MNVRLIPTIREQFRKEPVFSLAVGIGFLCSLLAVFFLIEPPNDLTTYYGRLAREFSQGNYNRAFYHMIPPLVPVLGGLAAKSGLNAFMALKIVSSLFFLAGLWPLRRLMRRVLPAHLVPWACLLYFICPRLVRYGTMGTLESAKFFFLLLLFERAVSFCDGFSWKKAVLLGIGAAGLCLARGEGIFLLPALWFVVAVALWHQRQGDTGKAIAGTLKAVCTNLLLCLVVGAPWLYYQYRITGFPCFDSRQVYAGKEMLYEVGLAESPPLSLNRAKEYGVKRAPDRPEDKKTGWRNVRETFKGLYPAYVFLAFAGLFRKWRKREYRQNWMDGLLAFMVVYNVGLFAMQGYITKRYISPTIPFILPWVTLGGDWIVAGVRNARFGSERLRRRAVAAGVTLFVLICVWDATLDIRPSWPPEPYVAKEVGKWIGRNRDRLDVTPAPPLQSADWGIGYHTGKQPVIAGYSSHYAYWADADLVMFDTSYEYAYETIVSVCRAKHVDILVTGKYWEKVCPAFHDENRHFEPCEKQWPRHGIRLYTFDESPR